MTRRPLTEADRAEITRRADAREPYLKIAADYGITRNGVSGIVYRKRRGWSPTPRTTRKLARPVEAFHMYRPVEPSKAPFAPDDSCPDFAHDDQHIAAVQRERPNGFPVAFQKRRRA